MLDLDNDLTTNSGSFLIPSYELSSMPPQASESQMKTLNEVEREHIEAVLHQTHGVIEGAGGAAKALGMHPNTLRHRMEKLGIKRTAHRIS